VNWLSPDQLRVKAVVSLHEVEFFKTYSALTQVDVTKYPPKAQLSGGNLKFWWSDVSRPFLLTCFMISIWVGLAISVSIKSLEITGPRYEASQGCYSII